MIAWAVTGANVANLHPYKITRFDAYEINSLLIHRSDEEGPGQVRFTTTIPGDFAAGNFDFSLLAKWDAIKSIRNISISSYQIFSCWKIGPRRISARN